MDLALFDFDGTLTTRETFPDFMGHAAPRWRLWVGRVVLAPLFVFVGKLGAVKRVGRLRYGAMASHHGRLFEQRWLGREDPPNESILEAPDISSLADVEPGFARVQKMRPVPIGRAELVPLAVACALPYAPLALLVMPLSEILKRLLGALT